MPVEVYRYSLGTPPTRTVERGSRAGQQVPRFEVILPGWSDIIHLSSDAALTPEERSIERQRRGASLARSPSPEIVRDLSAIGTAVDDIQDGLVTLSVLGRLSTKLIGKAIPGVGLITTAADAVNVFNVIYPNAAIRAGVAASDRAGAVLSGRKRYLASKSVKRALGIDQGTSLSTYARRLNETLKTGKVGFGLGEALQVAQTSDQLFGVGLSLGPIFGALQDSFFGIMRGARFDISGALGLTGAGVTASELSHMRQFAPASFDLYQRRALELAGQQGLPVPRDPVAISDLLRRNPVRVQVDYPGILPAFDTIFGLTPGAAELEAARLAKPLTDSLGVAARYTLQGIGAAKRLTVGAALKVWDSAKWLVGVRGDLSWQDHLVLLVAQALAVQELRPLMQQFDWGAAASSGRGGLQPLLPFCGRGCNHSRAPAAVASCLASGPAKFPLDWLDEIPSQEARDFAELTLIDLGGDLFEALEGPAAKIEINSGRGFRLLRLLHDYDLLPPYQRTDEELACFFDSLFPLLGDGLGAVPALDVVAAVYLRCFPGVES